ncbi:MAG: hypothetical protein V3R80_01170 [Candidatus Tectomicrobia bacterium]
MSVQVYGCNHIAIEVDDVDKGVAAAHPKRRVLSAMTFSQSVSKGSHVWVLP